VASYTKWDFKLINNKVHVDIEDSQLNITSYVVSPKAIVRIFKDMKSRLTKYEDVGISLKTLIERDVAKIEE
jgi:hypothetical protein